MNQQQIDEAVAAAPSFLANLVRLAAANPLDIASRDFYFLRHGQTDANRLRIVQSPEQDLNEAGLEQAANAARILASCGLGRIVASDMKRCRQTSEAVGRIAGVAPEFSGGLQERFFGDLIGQSSVKLDWDSLPPNGEALADFIIRTRAAITAALASPRLTLIVAHAGTLYVLASGLGLAIGRDLIKNANPLHFSFNDGWQVSAAE